MEGSNISSEDFAVGCLLSIKTTLGEEFEGQVITFDRPSNILVLHILLNFSLLIIQGSKPGPRRNLRFLKTNYIKEFNFLGQSEDPLDIKKCYIDLQGLQAREELALRLPVRWDKTSIVVMNEVRVSSPYLAENVTGGTAAANDRVKKVLELERRRLQTRGPGQ
ncbi:Protein LSM12 homolog B [Linum perenne]